jgi:hypothetical protein
MKVKENWALEYSVIYATTGFYIKKKLKATDQVKLY